MMRRAMALLAFLALVPVAAHADTLYQAGPPVTGPGHPLRLGPDHRAQQVGDLVYVQFDFNDANSHVNNYSSNKQFALSQTAGVGNLGLPLLRNASGLTGQSTTSTAQTATGADAFTSTMMATVTGVLPSGALEISGDQGVVINGRAQTLHITGTIRSEDVDSSDTIVASRVANVKASFKGDDQKRKGLLSRILSWLF
ncbi:MAG TPA: flagellar basal body L-ring protein FlgH [Candidatus Baltobacteraceae bacterium]|nr:flagellar basal body L-ring protein FlgH [Candidatus Baltobacteraceae bacterium]